MRTALSGGPKIHDEQLCPLRAFQLRWERAQRLGSRGCLFCSDEMGSHTYKRPPLPDRCIAATSIPQRFVAYSMRHVLTTALSGRDSKRRRWVYIYLPLAKRTYCRNELLSPQLSLGLSYFGICGLSSANPFSGCNDHGETEADMSSQLTLEILLLSFALL